jgi:uncharacterized protein (TIGR00661 family)
MKRKVLVCVLDWGLGHATRSLALARVLQAKNIDYTFASSGSALRLLRIEQPKSKFFELPSYNISYGSRSFMWSMLSQLPAILRVIRREKRALAEILKTGQFDAVISDCRYGCYHRSVHSIFLSHQLQIQLLPGWRLLKGIVNFCHRRLIGRFDECWVPDYPSRTLSGELSRVSLKRLTFIGPLTTMKPSKVKLPVKYRVLAVLSGPEPQRTIFANTLRSQLEQIEGPWLIVHGQPGNADAGERQVSYMTRDDLNEAINSAEIVVARSGYSTLMDIAAVGARTLFIPTPGQTEQLYLADRLLTANISYYQQQSDLNLFEALKVIPTFDGFSKLNGHQSDLLNTAIATLWSR